MSLLLLYFVSDGKVRNPFYSCLHLCFPAHSGFLINSWVQFKISIRLEFLLTIPTLFYGDNVWYKMNVTNGYCSLAINWKRKRTRRTWYFLFFINYLFSLIHTHSHWFWISPRGTVALALLSHILFAGLAVFCATGPRITFCSVSL